MRSDNELIEKYLQEYLIHHNTLIINDLGKFEVKYIGAAINPNINHISPPNCEVYFSAQNKETSSAFAEYIAEKENRSIADIENAIKQFVTTLKIEAGTSPQRKYQVEGVGVFYLTPDHELKFKQSENTNFYAQGYGLPNLFYKPLPSAITTDKAATAGPITEITETKETKKTDILDLGEEIEKETPLLEEVEAQPEEEKTNNALFISVLAALFVVTAFFIFAIFSGIESINPTNWFAKNKPKANMSVQPDKEETENTEEKKEESTVENTEKSENKNITKAEEKKEEKKQPEMTKKAEPPARVETPTPPPTTPSTEAPTMPAVPVRTNAGLRSWLKRLSNNTTPPSEVFTVKEAKGRFYVVLGTFSNANNAYILYNTLMERGYTSARVIEANGKYRVSYVDFTRREDASDEVLRLRKELGVESVVFQY
ncbi:MAG: SPOR domain-containing protein [Microscillaceae bacterium]|nr:SPOR domain-containing protein [Microscillaceae bacterium]MDW8459781.1 SPOR domain-containing protein [Cytophagales bacterium]